ncbi:MAG: tRNA (guanosine(37)-N1)-methyltransferase TrmD [Pseudomonadales bacterium]|nr:tRNA (guanosine(37)-N1)-methyltransferase TrmD [Pseudomonadales bacterium]
MTHFTVLSLFPEMFTALTEHGISSRAIKQQQLSLTVVNPRSFTEDRHRTVDDRPYGGGPGMLMLLEPLCKALQAAQSQVLARSAAPAKVVYLSPQGTVFNQAKAQQLASLDEVILIAGRYEGIDQRFIDHWVDEEISLGDYVVSGGELPAMMVIDAAARCIPGVLGHAQSAAEDSFFAGLLDHPQYTRPEVFRWDEQDYPVPEVLLGGNHQAIRRWRLQQAIGQTWLKRPDLLANKTLTDEESALLAAFKQALHTSE